MPVWETHDSSDNDEVEPALNNDPSEEKAVPAKAPTSSKKTGLASKC